MWRHLPEPRAKRDHQIAVADPVGDLCVEPDADMAAIAGMQIVEIVLAAERDADRHFMRRRKRLEIAACLIAPSAAADDHERLLRLRSAAHGTAAGRRRQARSEAGYRAAHPAPSAVSVSMSSGQRQHDRARTARGRAYKKRARDELRNPPRVVDLGDPFRHRPEHLPIVDFLERFALHHVAPDLARAAGSCGVES